MPDSITHAFFAEEVTKKLNIDSIKLNNELYLVGAQGPDPYFYYKFLPWKNNEGLPKIGNLLHSKFTQRFFLTYLDKLKENYSKNGYSFILGWICHYALDSITHPYIYHFTGNYIKTDKSTYSYRGNHLQLERSIDSIFLRRKGYNSNKFKATKEIFTLLEIPSEVVQLLDSTIKDIYGLDNMGNNYNNAYKDYRKSLNIMSYDPYGIKKLLYRVMDLFNRKSKFVYKTFSYYNNVNPKVDYLNESNIEWVHPLDDSEVSTESFIDLYNKAKNKAAFIITKVNEYMLNKNTDLSNVIKNITYDTGREFSDKSQMKYFNSIL
ncbi:zinc dependent phospholipase C family protein [Mycoplasmatota bacterium WC44]